MTVPTLLVSQPSAGSQDAIRTYRKRLGWAGWPRYATADDFSVDFDSVRSPTR
jgi:hypothetical protein